jgi:hypothetical protein
VETEAGQRKFAMKDPMRNMFTVSHDQVIVKDTHGNKFMIESIARLDIRSRAEIDKVL